MARKSDIQYIQFYTDGSAARQVAPKISRQQRIAKAVHPFLRKRRTVYVDPLALGGIAVAVVMLVLMFVGVLQLRGAQQDAVVMESYVETLKEQNADLQKQYDEKCDLEEIEKKALALGMIPKEEATQIPIRIQLPHQEEAPSFWEKIGAYLAGLFA